MVLLILRLRDIILILVGKSIEIREAKLGRIEISWALVLSCQDCQIHLSVWVMVYIITVLPFLTTNLIFVKY